MRTLLACALAAILVGCSCPLQPQTAMAPCTDANRFACFDRTAASQPIEPEPVSFKTDSARMEIKSMIVPAIEQRSSAHARGRATRAMKTAKSTMIAAKAEPPSSRIPLPHPSLARLQHTSNAAPEPDAAGANIADSYSTGDAVANSDTGTIQQQVAVATAVAERMTVANVAPAPHGDGEKSATKSPDDTDLLVAVLMARPEIKLVSDLSGKIIAIDDRYSSSNGNVRTAIAAAGAAEVQLSEGQAKAIDRFISAEVPAAVLTLVSAEAAERFPEIAGYKVFRIPLSPRSLKPRQ
jgi:hypothetical protein